MTLRTIASSAATRVGGALSILAIIAASVVGLHGWADDEATDIAGTAASTDAGPGITG